MTKTLEPYNDELFEEESDEVLWEAGFELGVKLADEEMVSEWDEEDDFI